MRFDITGYREPDGVVSLSLEAASANAARVAAGARGIRVLSLRRAWGLPSLSRSAPRFDLLLFAQELHALLDGGLSLIEALSALGRKESATDKHALIERLIVCIRQGRAFSQALREEEDRFPELFVSLASAAERTGDLPTALSRYIAYRQQMDAVRKRVVAAAIYPALLLVVGGAVILFLMGYVVPRFSRIYEDAGRDLPLMSRLLMHWGAAVRAHGIELFIGFAALLATAVQVLRKERLRRRLLDFLASRNGLRQRIHTYELARFYRTLGMLQQGGIPIVVALGMAGGLLGEARRQTLDKAVTDIKAGRSMAEALQLHDLAPPVAFDLLQVGQRTGDIGEKMLRIADFFDEDLARWLEWFAKLFEPLLMLAIGLFIAFIVVLLYLPVFELAGAIG